MTRLRAFSAVASVLAAALLATAPAARADDAATMSPPPGNLAAQLPKGTKPTAALPTAALPASPLAAPAAGIVAGTNAAPSAKLAIPPVDDEAPPIAFLDAARLAIAAKRLPEATEALERAESRALDRSVAPSAAGTPSQQPLVAQIGDARRALAAGDRLRAVQLIQAAMQNPDASAK